jgi:iron complex transport system substrate-binding protein
VRIVSLLPSATEIVFALGLGEQLDGVTYECDHPPEARSKPVVSGTALPQDRPLRPGEIDTLVAEFMERKEPLYQLDRDLLRKIQPDLILTQDLCRVCAVPTGLVQDALDELELGATTRVLSLDPHSLEDVLESILTVGRATGTEDRAGEVVAGLRQRIERVRRTALRLPSVRTLCVEWIDPPRVAGHWVPEMVEAAGGTNLLNEPKEPSRACSWRQAADANPEVVVLMPCGYYLEEAEEQAESLFALPDFAGTPAARGRAVFAVDATSYFSRPGPRLVDGLDILAWAIHPEAFPEPPPDRITRLRR